MEGFEYKPIDLDGPSFRLVRLFKGDDRSEIRCELFDAWADSNILIPYEALSYAWGSLHKTITIEVNGCTLAVTSNLFSALLHLRDREQDRILWIDAISIDQQNKEERGHQVKYMAEIYRNAQRVVVWLGPSTPEIEVIMLVIRKLQDECAQYPYRDWSVSNKYWKDVWSNIRPAVEGEAGSILQQRESLKLLLARPWFTRVWILQEIANAGAAIFVCGKRTILARFLAIIPVLIGIEPESQQQAVLDIIPGCSRDTSWWAKERDLYTILKKFKGCEASDPRDKIYALLGMSTDACNTPLLLADYGKSLSQVVISTISFLLSRRKLDQTVSELASLNLQKFFLLVDSFVKEVFTLTGRNDQLQSLRAIQGLEGTDDSCHTPLHWAAAHGYKRLVRALINDRVDVDIIDQKGETALMRAESAHHTGIVMLLIAHGADVNRKDVSGWTALFIAVHASDYTTIRVLIKKGAEVNSKNNSGETALFWAASKGDFVSVELLIKAGADVNSKNIDGETALFKAASKGYSKLMELLITAGADVNSKNINDETALFKTAGEGDVTAVELLIARGADVNSKNINDETALFKAASKGYSGSVGLLMKAGADVNARNNHGRTALFNAAANGHEYVVQRLIVGGAGVHIRDRRVGGGTTALFGAATGGHAEVLRVLIDAGADINADEHMGLKVSDWERVEENEIVQELVNLGRQIKPKMAGV